MARTKSEIKSRNFSLAFEQMCSMVAIAQTKDSNETLKELILQCFVVLPDERFQNATHLADTIDILFGLRIPEHEVQTGLDKLLKAGVLQQPVGSNLVLPVTTKAGLQERVDRAVALEDRVRASWYGEIREQSPTLPLDNMWELLRNYLARAFRLHGIQTAALLDPAIDITSEHSESLSAILDETLKGVPTTFRNKTRNAIADFLANAAKSMDRATYVAQLADGAFNYFSLIVAPDIAEQFRVRLSPLTLFLDTNFLFGILDLTINSQVAVSNDLLRAIDTYKFPFKLRFHEATERELRGSIGHYHDELRARSWPRHVSRAAASSRNLFGVELKYHQRNAETGIDVDAFFKPYDHVDVLLKQKNIAIHYPQVERLYERATLLADYKEYLSRRGKEKAYELIDHDTTVLDAVRQIRSKARSSIHAGALLITCDYGLYRFDWESSKSSDALPSTVLPNIFWQILRPFVPSSTDLDRTFAETFAIPQFRIIGSGAAKACSKMLSILAGYEQIPEETASRLLSNDLLIDRLRGAKNDKQFQEHVEAAIIGENAVLLEENAALAKQLQLEMAEKLEKQRLLELEIAEREKDDRALQKQRLEQERRDAQDKQSRQQDEVQRTQNAQRLEQAIAETERERKTREDVLLQVQRETQLRNIAEQRADAFGVVAAIALTIIAIATGEILVRVSQWSWLINHPNAYGLRGTFALLILLFAVGAFIPKWRKLSWGSSGAMAVLLVLFSLLGGPRK